jgi:hypothetical protein
VSRLVTVALLAYTGGVIRDRSKNSDPVDSNTSLGFVGRAFPLSIHEHDMIDSVDIDHFLMHLNFLELWRDNEDFDS